MQDRRYRPGDVLDDYCPRERRITDHAIVAMIDEEIRRTRCGVCDAEHEYKEARVPSPRRKTQPPALFTQVLEGMNGPAAKPHPAAADPEYHAGTAPDEQPVAMAAVTDDPADDTLEGKAVASQPPPGPTAPPEPDEPVTPADADEPADGGFRRSLIRATFPRPEGQAPVERKLPEFTIQSLHNRRNGQRQAAGQNKFRGGRRRPGGTLDNIGPMRFRDHGHGQGNTQGQGQGQGGRRRRGGKKNR